MTKSNVFGKVFAIMIIIVMSTVISGCEENTENAEPEEKTQQTISLDPGDGELEEDELQMTASSGSQIDLPEPKRKGYAFSGWYTESQEAFNRETMPSSDTKLYAEWDINEHTISFDAHDGTSVSDITKDYGEDIAAPEPPEKEGYSFEGWYETKDYDQEYAFETMPDEDMTLHAKWNVKECTLGFDTHEGTSVADITKDYDEDIVAPESPEKEGYSFSGWYETADYNQEYTFETMPAEDLTLHAKWDANEYTVTFDTHEGTSVADITKDYDEDIVAPEAPEKEGYSFEGWYETADYDQKYDFETMPAEDLTLHAKWEEDLSEVLSFEAVDGEITILSYEGEESELILPDTINGYPVTMIESNAFKGNSTLTDVIVGKHVKTIYYGAFSEMSALEHLELPNSAQTIGSYLLSESNAVEKIVLSSELEHELKHYFGRDMDSIPDSLNTVKYANGAENIDKTLTQNPMGEVTLELAEDWTTIAEGQFKDSEYLEAVRIPSSVTEIRNTAFSCAYNLTEVTFEADSQLETIGYNAFNYVNNMTSIEIPATVTSIGSGAFSDADSLSSVHFDEDSELETIGHSAFRRSDSLTYITIPSSVTEIGDYAFNEAGELTKVFFEEDSQLKRIGNYAFKDAKELSEIVIPSSVLEIGSRAFYSDFYLGDLTIFTGVSERPIGWDSTWNPDDRYVVWGYEETIVNETIRYATTSNNTISILELSGRTSSFSDADTDLVIPSEIDGKEVTQIVDSAFKGEIRLKSVHIPNTITEIHERSFYGANNLETVTFDEDSPLDSIGEYAFAYASSLTSIEVPASVTEIGDSAFKNASALTSIEIPSGVTKIGTGAFQNADSLTDVTFEEVSQLESIGNVAFQDASALTSIEIPASVTKIGSAAFKDASSLTTVTFEEHSELEKIAWRSFEDASSLTIINIPSSVTEIAEDAFLRASSLSEVTFEEESQLESIEAYAFDNAKSLTTIEIPSSVTKIDAYAFDNVYSLTIFTELSEKPKGWETGWGNEWNPEDRPVHWGVQTYDSKSDNIQYALLNDDTIKIAGLTFDNTSEDINIPSDIDGYTVNEIQSYAFMNHDYLNSVYIPDTITVIGENAFENYTGTINVEAESKPENWDDNWNPENATVNWGYTPE